MRERCQALSGSIDHALIDGRLMLPEEFVTETSARAYSGRPGGRGRGFGKGSPGKSARTGGRSRG